MNTPRLEDIITHKMSGKRAEVVGFQDDGEVVVCEWRENTDNRRFFLDSDELTEWFIPTH